MAMRFYKSYSFIDKDPAIDIARTRASAVPRGSRGPSSMSRSSCDMKAQRLRRL